MNGIAFYRLKLPRFRALRLLTAVWVATFSPTVIPTAYAQALTAPSEVILYIHSEMKRRDFVERLECALKHILVAPVSTQDLQLPLGSDLMASPTQFDVQKVANKFLGATIRDAGPRAFRYLLLPFDLKDAEHPYVFSTSFISKKVSAHVGIFSTARLDTRTPDYPGEQNSEQTAHRLYKMILKSVARLAGLKSTAACVLAFPGNLEEFDRKSPALCPDDRATLVAAGILKREEEVGADCALTSRREMPLAATRLSALSNSGTPKQ